MKYISAEGDTSHLSPGTTDLSAASLFTGIHAADQAVIFGSRAARLIDNPRKSECGAIMAAKGSERESFCFFSSADQGAFINPGGS